MPKPKKKCEAFIRNLGVNSCEQSFEKRRMGQKVCSVPCSIAVVNDDKLKKKKSQTRQMKRDLRENDLGWWLAVGNGEANKNGGNTAYWLHRWIRLVRDKFQPCIMCGRTESNDWHACHFRSRGAAKQLRFEPDNIHKGCGHCNTYTKGDTGAMFRINLAEKIGEEATVALETNNELAEWTIEKCRAIRDDYKARCKEAGV